MDDINENFFYSNLMIFSSKWKDVGSTHILFDMYKLLQKVLSSCLLKQYLFMRNSSDKSATNFSLLCFFYLYHRIQYLPYLLFLTYSSLLSLARSSFFLFLFNNDMNMCVTHDSHKHFEIYELRPRVSRCIIMPR